MLARRARLNARREDAESLLLHAEGLAVQRGWLRALAPLLAERLSQSLQDGDISAAEALLSRLQALAEDADKATWRTPLWP